MLASILVVSLSLLPLAAPATVQELSENNAEFALDVYREIRDREDGNIFFSPFSISTALAMTYLGAKENTATQMANTLKFTGLSDVHSTFQNLIADIEASQNDNLQMSVANRLFGSNTYTFQQIFKDESQTYYSAGMQELDFQQNADGSRIVINEWVEDQTNNKIEDLLPPPSINSMTILVLVNAIYFKGSWKVIFEEQNTQLLNFYLNGSHHVQTDLMNVSAYFHYGKISALDSKMVKLPYDGETVSMYVVLPNDRNGIDQLEQDISVESINSAIETGLNNDEEVEVVLPKFSVTMPTDMVPILKDLGMTDIFTSTEADLSGIGGDPGDLYVSGVYHKAFIEVNEEGTEAAAATAVVVTDASAMEPQEPRRFIADHPFLYFIRDESTGSILFMGKIMNPAPEGTAINQTPGGSTTNDDDCEPVGR